MEDRKYIILIFLTVIFLFSGLTLYAQVSLSESQQGYLIDKSGGELVFKQRLVWDKEEFASRYEVVIEIFSEQYNEYYREITDKNFIEISLSPGRYQYCVTPFDLLGQRGDASNWERLDVMTAFQPEITKITPDFFYMDQFQDRVIIITGNNIFKDSVIYLRNKDKELMPISKVMVNNTSVRLTFDDEALVPGVYELYIKNPGGLDTFFSGFLIGYYRRLETFFKMDYNPVIPISGQMQNMFGTALYYPGATLRLESLSSQRASFKAGLEFAVSYYLLEKNRNDSITNNIYTCDETLVDFTVNILMQMRFNHLRNAISFAFGFGISSSNTVSDEIEYNLGEERNGHMNLSVSSLFLIYKNLNFEAGADLTYYLSNTSVLLKPRIGLVWRI
jgi:hypothetical protein